MVDDYYAKASKLIAEGRPFVTATVIRAEKPTSAKAGARAIITGDGALVGWVGGSCTEPTVKKEARKALQDGQPRLVRLCPPESRGEAPQEGVIEVELTCVSGGTLEIYVEPYQPRPHLVTVGHLPVSESLVALGKALGYAVTVVTLEEDHDSFKQADLVLERLDVSKIAITPQTYFVIASHGNYDELALEAALKTNAPYVALVASKKRLEAIMQYLRDSDLTEEQLSRLKCPAGLDFGAVTPEEIALSILAEIIQKRRREPVDTSLVSGQVVSEPAEAKDPVCGMMVEIATARYTTEHAGHTYYFCAAGCKASFEKEPEKYLMKS